MPPVGCAPPFPSAWKIIWSWWRRPDVASIRTSAARCRNARRASCWQRLGLALEQFIECSAQLLLRFGSAVGVPEHLIAHCAARQVKYLRGIGAARRMAETRAA